MTRVLQRAVMLLILAAFLMSPASAEMQIAGSVESNSGVLRLEIRDPQGAAIEGASVKLINASGTSFDAVDVTGGRYEISGLAGGRYTIRISAPGFAPYESRQLEILGAGEMRMGVSLPLMRQTEEIVVFSEAAPIPVPQYLGGVRVLRGKAIDNLPDTDQALLAYLRVLAPRSTGPFGPTILVDGFRDGQLPPKSSIREIRISDNPFSSEYSDVGDNRIEIFTKPGTDNWQSRVFVSGSDESLNSRNPFAESRAPFQARILGFNLSGPLVPKRVTLFADAERVEFDDNAIVAANTLDSGLVPQPFNLTLIKPSRRNTINGSLGYQLNRNNTLVVRFRGTLEKSSNEGVGGFSLPSRSYESFGRAGTVQFTETAVLSPQALNDTRFEFRRQRIHRLGDILSPVINVGEAFVAGGADIGRSLHRDESFTLVNTTSWIAGNHVLKFGADQRYAILRTHSSTNFGGTYTFTGRTAPLLDETGEPVPGEGGEPIMAPISNLESYRRTLLFQRRGLPPAQIRQLGGGAGQYSVGAGGADVRVPQYELGVFLQHDWRLAPSFTFNSGARYEVQSNLRGRPNFAPRVSLAWEPVPEAVLRLGSGLFYDPLSEEITLQTRLFNGDKQRQFFTTDPRFLDLFPNSIPAESLGLSTLAQSVWRVSDKLRMPYSVHSSLSLELKMPLASSLTLTATSARRVHALRSRNVNAPLADGSRPLGTGGEVFQIESSGISDTRQLTVNTTHNVGAAAVLWTSYTLSHVRSDTGGSMNFPADTYDLRGEYGLSESVARNTFYFGGWIRCFGGLEFTPLIMWRSGLPFNITTGQDRNGDTQFMERPAFAVNPNQPGVIVTRYGAFDLEPVPGQSMIPRNFGIGPSFAMANVRVSRTFRIGDSDQPEGRRFLVIPSIQIYNVLNRYNPGTPVGNLSSPFFGRSTSAAGDFGFGSNSAGNRRIEFSMVFAY